MHRATLIIAVVAVGVVGWLFVAPRIVLYAAQRRAIQEFADGRAVLNAVPQSPFRRIAPAGDYTNSVWMDAGGCAIGFPADYYVRDSDPKRGKGMLHHLRYRILVLPGLNAKEFDPVMQPLNETNFYGFIISALNATERDIPNQRSMDALMKHLILLKVKRLLPIGIEESCILFDRGDLKGFIILDPTRSHIATVCIYIESEQKLVYLGVIQEARIGIADLEKLISFLKVQSSNTFVPGEFRLDASTNGPEALLPAQRH